MPEPVLVDTDVISFLFKQHPLAAGYSELLSGRNVLVSLATSGEIEFGMLAAAWGPSRRDRMRQFLNEFTVLNPDSETARIWASVRFQCRKLGRTIAPTDAWIAATALQFSLALVTHNAGDYSSVEGLVILRP